MHSLTVQTKYTFGDRVRVNSEIQGCAGTGEIVGITIQDDNGIHYTVAIERGETLDYRAGIVDSEVTLVESAR